MSGACGVSKWRWSVDTQAQDDLHSWANGWVGELWMFSPREGKYSKKTESWGATVEDTNIKGVDWKKKQQRELIRNKVKGCVETQEEKHFREAWNEGIRCCRGQVLYILITAISVFYEISICELLFNNNNYNWTNNRKLLQNSTTNASNWKTYLPNENLCYETPAFGAFYWYQPWIII